jgi:UDP:flavonoid glycosyltransferase YjiC (YdhE family)
MWFKRVFFRFADWFLMDRALKNPVNEFRTSLGLPPIDRIMHRWLHSTQLVIGFFPDWFARPQPDWPPRTHLVGFPLWDSKSAALPADALEFLAAGAAPVVFTPGSAGATMHRYFNESVDAVRALGVRAMLVTNFPEQVPTDLPPGVKTFGYLPFSGLLPHAAMLVYHGGIGTLAQTLKAGIPHLVVPNGHDQFDNAFRIEQLGLGRGLPQTRYRARRVVDAIKTVLGNAAVRSRARDYAARLDGEASVARACELIEGLAIRRT